MLWMDHEEYLEMECDEHCRDDGPMDMDNAMNDAPPSEEGHEKSHAGGDHEGF